MHHPVHRRCRKKMKEKNRWVSLIACCVINLCLGSIYSWSVFSQAMAEYLNKTAGLSLNPGDLAIVYTVANCIGPVTMIIGGRVNDLFGPRFVIMGGGILFGAGMLMSGFAQSVGFIVFSFGVLGGLGLGMAYGSVISTAVKLFPDKRGFVGGITTAAYGISSVIIPPVISAVISGTDAPFAFKLTGTVFMVIIGVASLFVGTGKNDAASKNEKSDPGHDLGWRSMIKTSSFYLMLVILICGAFSGMMIISQASPIAISVMDMSAAEAAVTVSVLALFNTAGRIIAGSLSDRIGRIWTLRLSCTISALAEVCLLLSEHAGTALFYIGIAAVGLSFGGFMGVYPGFTADRFGLKNNSVNYGIMCIGFALAGYLGPLIAKSTYDTTGSYGQSFLYACLFSAAGLIFTFIYKLTVAKEKKEVK